MKKLIIILLLASGNSMADSYSVESSKDIKGWYFIDGVPQGQTSLKTIIDKDGHKTITDGDAWVENVRNYRAPIFYVRMPSNSEGDHTRPPEIDNQTISRQSNDNQAMISELRQKAKDAMEHGGIGGLVAARQYTDMANGMEASQNGTYDDYQQTRALNKIGRTLNRIETQQIIDRTMAPWNK